MAKRAKQFVISPPNLQEYVAHQGRNGFTTPASLSSIIKRKLVMNNVAGLGRFDIPAGVQMPIVSMVTLTEPIEV